MDKHYVTCACYSAEHTVRFMSDDEDVWVEVQLRQHRSIFHRIFVAFKYIFGYNSKYGHWDCTVLSEEEGKKLMHFLKRKYK